MSKWAEPWTSLEEVTEHLGVSQVSAHQRLPARGLPGNKAGHFWKFKLKEVGAWVRTAKTGSWNRRWGSQASGC